ncbi:MAG: hypothetical protein J5I98_13395 [Phaeodactylibacter sp.]|nr:hypothetical protein [Phaeodactylibacter sp.]
MAAGIANAILIRILLSGVEILGAVVNSVADAVAVAVGGIEAGLKAFLSSNLLLASCTRPEPCCNPGSLPPEKLVKFTKGAHRENLTSFGRQILPGQIYFPYI